MASTVLPFAKYSGNGNDFVILDRPVVPITKDLVRSLCDRHFGIGADGVLVLTSVDGSDAQMRIFNADGGEAEMCGNGLRCVATYLDDVASMKKNTYRLKTMNNSYIVVRQGPSFAIEMSEMRDKNIHDLSDFKQFEKSFFINTGVPHLVFLGKDIKNIDIKSCAPEFRFNPRFPGGTNVNFVEVTDEAKHEVYVRTYERGVEDETNSCGTGLTACALALSDWFGWEGEIHLRTKGGYQRVDIGSLVLFSGEVKRCFKGEVEV